jgi:hypothetical protein
MQGANRAAAGAQAAGMAQQEEARRQFGELAGMTKETTVAGLANYDKAIAAQERNLARQEQLIAQIDPTIMEASQQALRLMRGEQASTLGPLKQQRDAQRQQLVNTLREQLGPGAETSTAGIQALTRFDQETSGIFAGAQQQALQGLGQTFGAFSSYKPSMLQESRGLGALGGERAGLQMDRARVLAQAGQPMIQSAGAQFTGDVMRGQGQQAFGASMFGAGLQQIRRSFMSPEEKAVETQNTLSSASSKFGSRMTE